MSYSVSISGHGDNPAGASCYYSFADGRPSKSASYSGKIRQICEDAAAFIEQCQREEKSQESIQDEDTGGKRCDN